MIQNIKDLEKLLKLLRRQGVTEFTHGELILKMGDLPAEPRSAEAEVESADPYAGFPEGMLTPEQLIFYSAGGSPADDPLNQVNP